MCSFQSALTLPKVETESVNLKTSAFFETSAIFETSNFCEERQLQPHQPRDKHLQDADENDTLP